MEENAKKQTVLIEALTKLIQTQHTNFTNTLNHQQVLINDLQADLANTKKAHNGKMKAVMNLGIDNFALLDEKLGQIGMVIIRKTDEVMTHAEEKINKIVPTKEELGQIVDEMADQLYEKCMSLPYKKKTNDPSDTKDNDDLSDGKLFPNQEPAEPAEPEGDARPEETKEEDPETQSMKVERPQAGRKQEVIEIEDSDAVKDDDAAEDDDDDKWAKQQMSEDATMVAVDQITSSITSTESPTPTTLTSVTSTTATTATTKTKRTRLHSLPSAPTKPPRAGNAPSLPITNFFKVEQATKGAGLGSR